ncbi:MAG: hypothetical protein ACOH5I_24495 [Oligoflexus sp.]
MKLLFIFVSLIFAYSSAFAGQPDSSYPCGEHKGEPLYCNDNITTYYVQTKESLLNEVSSGTGGFPGVVYKGVVCSSWTDPALRCPESGATWYQGPGLPVTGTNPVSVNAVVHFDIKTFCMNSYEMCRGVLSREHIRFELLVNGKAINRPISLIGPDVFKFIPSQYGFEFDLNNQISGLDSDFHTITLTGAKIAPGSKIDVRISNLKTDIYTYYLHAVEIYVNSPY